MKCIKKQGKHVMQYLKVSNETAKYKVKNQGWNYTSKQEFKSKESEFIKNEGTLVNVSKDGDKKLINRKSFKAPKKTSSTKLAKSSVNNPNFTRTGKFQKANITLKELMKLSLNTFKKENEIFKSEQERIQILKERKELAISNFKRNINEKD